MTNRPTPGQPAPALEVKTVGGQTWNLNDSNPDNFTMVVFYRGLHCPVCKKYLEELQDNLGKFEEHGVEVIAISGDTEARARKAHDDWDVEDLNIGYGHDEQSMREWGLYVSESIKDGEPGRFGEPGLFLVRPDGTLYWASIGSMPFARPKITEVASAIGWILDNDYPARGTR